MTNPFYFSNGQAASTSRELQSILENVNTQDVQEHVTQGNFANWIRHELGNNTLADRITQCRSVQQVIDVLHLEHTPKPRPEIPKPAPRAQREPIRDLQRPSATVDDVPTHTTSQPQEAPEIPKQRPAPPNKLPKQGFLERYNAKEFVIGLAIGVVLGILLYALMTTLA